jgi:nucleoside-diphosphate-sugar epimerase
MAWGGSSSPPREGPSSGSKGSSRPQKTIPSTPSPPTGSKLACERYVNYDHAQYGVPYVVPRYSNLKKTLRFFGAL